MNGALWAGGDENYWRPDRPPVLAVVRPGQPVEVVFEATPGCGAEVVFTTDGTQNAAGAGAHRVRAVRCGTRGPADVLAATIPGLPEGTAVRYTYRAVLGDRSVHRPGGWVAYVVSTAPTDLDDPRWGPEHPESLLRPSGPVFASPPSWNGVTIYHLLVDRFCDGDQTNNRLHYAGFDPSRADGAHGGDLAGVHARLDYIREMGFTALWLSPVMQNWWAYHGFEVCNFLDVDRRLGTWDELRALVRAAHERGMWVVLDMPFQHMARALLRYEDDRGRFDPAGHPVTFAFGPLSPVPLPLPTFFRDAAVRSEPRRTFGRFHRYGVLSVYDDQGCPESQAELGDLFGLSDLDTENGGVRAAMSQVARYWIAQADVDGFRLDAVKHAELGFWQTLCPAVREFAAQLGKERFLLFGEYLDGDPARIVRYVHAEPGGPRALGGAEDYPWYFALRDVVAGGASTAALEAADRQAAEVGLGPEMSVRFLDNHDQPRFLEVAGGRRSAGMPRLRAALALLLLGPGVPAVYYGTEQGFDGGRDHLNREDMFHNPEWAGDSASEGQDSFNPLHPLYRHIRRLHLLRADHAALQRGRAIPRWHDDPGTHGVYVFSRVAAGEEVVVALNLGEEPVTLPAVSVADGALRPGDVLEDALSDDQPLPQRTVCDDLTLSLELPPGTAQAWVPSPPE